MSLSLTQFDYHLPKNLIAQKPASPRDSSRLLVLNRQSHTISHHRFYDLPSLLPKDSVLVFNQTKVIPARLFGYKTTGGKAEILLLNKISSNSYEAITFPGIKPQQKIIFSPTLEAAVIKKTPSGLTTLNFNLSDNNLLKAIDLYGQIPLPPYIHSKSSKGILKKQYQTIYAKNLGSAAAPTAGLHFTQRLFDNLQSKHFDLKYITLHVGLGTFKNPTPEQIQSHTLHQEHYEVSTETADFLNNAKKAGRPIIAVGTTSARTLESCANNKGILEPSEGNTNLFIQPGYKFKFVDHLITNFHVPQSSLLMLVSALCEKDFTDFSSSFIGSAYKEAIKKKYRFFSFGDACLIL